MTECQWQNCTDPRPMLDWLAQRVTQGPWWWLERFGLGPLTAAQPVSRLHMRQHLLFACACCRRLWGWLDDVRSRRAVEITERYAEGQASGEERYAAYLEARAVADRRFEGLQAVDRAAQAAGCAASVGGAGGTDPHGLRHQAQLTALYGSQAAAQADPGLRQTAVRQIRGSAAEYAEQARLLRDLCNPFHGVTLPPALQAWSNGLILRLAQAAAEERLLPQGTLDPVLADALEEAGYGNVHVLAHLRGPGSHSSGCWVLDALTAGGSAVVPPWSGSSRSG